VIPLVDDRLGFRKFAGFPLDWIADAAYDPLYGAAILAVIAEFYPLTVRGALRRGFWLVPRLWLIELKVALWALAVPYLVLHLGAATILTIFPTYNAAHALFALTILTLPWLAIVVIRYMLSSAVLVAETQGETWDTAHVPSTGWTLWAAAKLVRGNVAQGVAVIALGQGLVSLLVWLLPSGENIPLRILSACGMIVTALWWALLWQFTRHCIDTHAVERKREVSHGHHKVR
jgi:hypothetical protein